MLGEIMFHKSVIVAFAAAFFASAAGAQELVSGAKASFIFNGERIKISRGNPQAPRFAMQFAAPAQGCGEPCIAPMQAAPGVATLDETQVLQFLTEKVAGNVGLMVDARTPEGRAQGFIPGTVSLPYTTVHPENGFRDQILQALGAREFDGVFNFADARELLIYDHGPSADDAGRLIRNLLAAGYPEEKLHYYRGGMQVWSVLGFSIEVSQS